MRQFRPCCVDTTSVTAASAAASAVVAAIKIIQCERCVAVCVCVCDHQLKTNSEGTHSL